MAAALKPEAAQKRIELAKWRVGASLDKNPIPGIAESNELEEEKRLRRAGFVLKAATASEMPDHCSLGSGVAAERTGSDVG